MMYVMSDRKWTSKKAEKRTDDKYFMWIFMSMSNDVRKTSESIEYPAELLARN